MNPQLHRILGGILRPLVRSWGKRRLAKHTGEMLLPGLGSPVEIRRDAQGVPQGWVAMMRRSLVTNGPRFSATRMLRDYIRQVYPRA